MKHCVIVGASHAAAQVCVSLRQGGWDGEITLVGDEPILPYHRPPLSKEFLSDDKSAEDLLIRPKEVYDTANISLRLGLRVMKIDRGLKQVFYSNGETQSYDKLILATGARVRRLPIKGESLKNVFYLRDKSNVDAIKPLVSTGKKAVIIGGGYIGLETAASLRKQGVEVELLEAMPRILQRVTAPQISKFYKRVHQEEGVVIHEGVAASEISKTPKGLSILAKDGSFFEADFVIIGIGVIPNTELADESGLKVKNGIAVNEFCQTTDPSIYAAGDVTYHFNTFYQRKIRLESVPNATEQAKTIANHIIGKPKPYDSLPWFWSDQFDLKLQIAGLSEGYDNVVVRGDINKGRSFAAYYFIGDTFIAVDAVNAPRDFMFGKMTLTKKQNLDKTLLANGALALKDCYTKS